MKTLMLVLLAVFVSAGNASAVITVGDSVTVVGPDSTSIYYLLDQGNWLGYQAFAVDSLGGSLTIINDPLENYWIYDTFRVYPDVSPGDHFAIGLYCEDQGDTWMGPLGEELDYLTGVLVGLGALGPTRIGTGDTCSIKLQAIRIMVSGSTGTTDSCLQ